MLSADLSPKFCIQLNNEVRMPIMGLGTWGLEGEQCYRVVKCALQMGYRLIDTASMYGNEAEIGRAFRDSGLSRDDVFITTKVASKDQGYEETLAACQASLDHLGLSFVDLYMIHWPVVGKNIDTWKAMEELFSKGKCRAIGVSNFSIPLIEEIKRREMVLPAVNQIEFNPFVYEREMFNYCAENGIHIEAYSPLTRGICLQDKTLLGVAHAYGKSPAQILLRWALQKGVTVIPKATSVKHLKENLDIFDFELYFGDMDKLDALSMAQCLIDR